MQRLLLAGVVVLALGGATAFAADMPLKAPPKAPVPTAYDWSGFYIGGGVGWQDSRINLSDPTGGTVTFAPSHSSVAAGGFAGLQQQFGQVVLGIEGGYTAGFNQASLGLTPSLFIFFPGGFGTGDAKLKDIWNVGGRIGWAINNWMPYITGGYASGRFGFDAQSAPPFFGGVQTATATQNGGYLGGGIEWAVMNSGFILGAEYRHYFFNPATVIATGGGAPPETVRFDTHTDTVMGRVSYKFSWAAPVVANH